MKNIDSLAGKLHVWCKYDKDNTFQNDAKTELQASFGVNVLIITKAGAPRNCWIYEPDSLYYDLFIPNEKYEF